MKRHMIRTAIFLCLFNGGCDTKNTENSSADSQESVIETVQSVEMTPGDYHKRALDIIQGKDGNTQSQEDRNLRAYDDMKRAADLGHSEAQVALARAYLFGAPGIPVDEEKGLHWAQEASLNENSTAHLLMGEYYLSQALREKTELRQKFLNISHEHFRAAAALGNSFAKARLSELYFMNHEGFRGDSFLARKYAEDAYAEGETYSAKIIFQMYTKGRFAPQDIQHAFKILGDAVKKGDPDATLIMAKNYITGVYLDKNLDKAAYLLQKLGNFKSGKAYYWLGVLYQSPEFTKKDSKTSMEYLNLAASYNNPEALHALAVQHIIGTHAQQNNELVREYLAKATKFGHPKAIALKHRLMTTGDREIFDRDPIGARSMLEDLSNQGIPYATFKLADVYIHQSDKASIEKGKDLLENAIAQDVTDAINLKAELCAQGKCGYPKNLKESRALYKTSAERMNLVGLIKYGEQLFNGDGGKKDQKLALRYIEQAARLNPALKPEYEKAKKQAKIK